MAGLDVFVVGLAGAFAGLLGALLGVGGGVFLVPFLITALGLPFSLARGISLMTVVATSSAVAAGKAGQGLVNVRLALLLQVATVTGGLTGGLTSRFVSGRTLTALFAAVMLGIAAVMASRLNTRNLITDPSAAPGVFGGTLVDPDLGQAVIYRLRRLPLALVLSFVSGSLSSLLGIGGGVLIVPALNAWCGIPMRVAAATSAFMIGVTATAALPIYWVHDEVIPHLAAGAVLGVLLGSRAGLALVTRLRIRWLKVLMVLVLLAVAALMFSRLG
jgi:uncharacterized membrane protein YfcA